MSWRTWPKPNRRLAELLKRSKPGWADTIEPYPTHELLGYRTGKRCFNNPEIVGSL
jgi:hypothetical protein